MYITQMMNVMLTFRYCRDVFSCSLDLLNDTLTIGCPRCDGILSLYKYVHNVNDDYEMLSFRKVQMHHKFILLNCEENATADEDLNPAVLGAVYKIICKGHTQHSGAVNSISDASLLIKPQMERCTHSGCLQSIFHNL